MATQPNYYTNPAFCQQSEFYNAQLNQRALSPKRNLRQSPLGAQTNLHVRENSHCEERVHQIPRNEDAYEEQEFYEEMLVDDAGVIQQKKFVVIAQNNEGKKYIQVPQNEEKQGSRYGIPPQIRNEQCSVDNVNKSHKQRYEYIQLQEHDRFVNSAKSPPKKKQYEEESVEVESGRLHRYAVIQAEEETELTTKNARYALVPIELKSASVSSPIRHRYEYIQEQSPIKPQAGQGRYEYIQISPNKPSNSQRNPNRYEYIQHVEQRPVQQRPGNPIATQKLHELLSTPKKTPNSPKVQTPQRVMSPQSGRRIMPPPLSPIPKDPFQTPPKTPNKAVRATNPKAQQKLNYALSTRQVALDKRYTAIVAPMCSSPVQSVYSETTFSNKTESWMNLSVNKAPVQATLAVAAVMMLLCGAVATGLSFYMISQLGRLYYLDFSVVAGFTCLLLGLLGFRTRNCYWLPNRNYISGYIILSLFSLLTCVGLLILLVMQPKPGTPLADMTSGAVCGISVLSLVVATSGVVASYCCRLPPPDNRVQHCAQGFTV